MTAQKTINAALLVLLAVLGGCDRAANDDNEVDLQTDSTVVSVEVATKFAQDFEHAARIQDQDAIHAFFDWEHILDEATKDAEDSNEEAMKSFREGARNSYEERGLGAELTRLAAAGGTVKFLRVREAAGRTTVLFRLTLPSGSGMTRIAELSMFQ